MLKQIDNKRQNKFKQKMAKLTVQNEAIVKSNKEEKIASGVSG